MDAPVGKRIQLLAPSESGSATPDDGLRQVIKSIRGHKRLIRTIIVVGTLLVGAISFSIPATYLATAQLAVDIQSNATNVAAPPNAEESIIDTHITVLLSDAYLRRLLPLLNEKKVENNAGAWRTLVSETWSEIKALIRKPVPEDVAALSSLKRNLRAGQERRSRIISVTFSDSNPQRAADIVNIITQSYADEVARQEQASIEHALDTLATQVSRIQHDLTKAGDELKDSRPDDREALEWRTTTLAQQLEMSLRRRQELTASVLTVQPNIHVIALASPPNSPASLPPLLIVPPTAIILTLLACLFAVLLDRFIRPIYTEFRQ
jgi:polysaccharide biosynthesis transport protein